MGNKNKSVSSNEKSQKPKDSKGKKDKKPDSEKKEIAVFINEEEALKIVDGFLTHKFEGGRHGRRVDKISKA